MGQAIQSVKHLTFNVISLEKTNPEQPECVHWQRQRAPSIEHEQHLIVLTNPASVELALVSAGVMSALAVAVPNLTDLSLDGSCFDASLEMFGSSCPKLTSLHVQAPRVPITALQNLAQKVPNVTAISVSILSVTESDMHHLGRYMQAFLLVLQTHS